MIYFVVGIPYVGKSTFIKEKFPGCNLIDIFEFQKDKNTVEEIIESFYKTKDFLIETITNKKETDILVLEHTLFKANRRKEYLDAIRSVTNEPVILYYLDASDDVLIAHSLKRNNDSPNNEDAIKKMKEVIAIEREIIEKPTENEGFLKVINIEITQ